MSFGSPTPPAVPNPYQVSQAQTGTNVNSAIASSALSNANTVSPYGSTTYTTQPSGTTIEGINVPQYTQTTTLAPEQQQMLDLRNQTGLGLNQLALQETGQISNLLNNQQLGQGLMGMGELPTQVSYGSLPNGPAQQTPTLQTLGGAPQLQQSVGVQQQKGQLPGASPLTTDYSVYGAQGFNQNFNPTSGINNNLGYSGPISFGFGQGGDIQSGFGATGDISHYLTQPGSIQNQFGGFGPIQNSIGPTDYEASRKSVEDAMLSRINPQLDRDRTSLDTNLVNQGYVRGTQAYNTAMDEANRQATDARMQAILAGGQEQSRLAGLALQSGQFANQAEQQAYQQSMGQAQFGNEAQQQAFGQDLSANQFQNQAAQQEYQEALSRMQAGNQAQQQGFTQDATRTQIQNAAEAQAYQEALSRGQFANAAAGQGFSQNLQTGQFNNQAAAQNTQNAANSAAFQNSTQNQQFGQNLQTGQFANQAAAGNTAAALASGQFVNQAAGQAFAQQQAQLAFNNTVATQGADAANKAAMQAYQNAVAQVQQNNSNAQQTYSNQLSTTQLQNQMNAQQLQQQFALQSFPINQVTALMSGGQIQNPQVTPYQSGQIQPTNLAGNVYNSAALQNQQYQQQVTQNNAMMGGLFGLGGTALLGGLTAFSDRRLKRDVIDLGIKLMNGIKLYSYKYLWDAITRVGIMADEVVKVKPVAVHSIGGYAVVDYALAMEAN